MKVNFFECKLACSKLSPLDVQTYLTNILGKVIYKRSAGMEGFKNCRKGTNVAGQTTGLSVGSVS